MRIDDKLNRIQQGAGLLDEDEDVIVDLIGYLVLLKIALPKALPMNYEQFLAGYTPHLGVIDAIDLLKHLSPDALDTLDQMQAESKDDKNDESRDQKDPTP